MKNTHKTTQPVTLDVWEKRMKKHVLELSQELKIALKSRRAAKSEIR